MFCHFTHKPESLSVAPGGGGGIPEGNIESNILPEKDAQHSHMGKQEFKNK